MTTKGFAIIPMNSPKEMVEKLAYLGFRTYKTIGLSELDERVKYHTDLQCHLLANGVIVVAPVVYNYYKDILSQENISVIKGDTNPRSPYPYDILYNIKAFESFIMGRLDHIDQSLLNTYKELNYETINVTQGYTGCSILTDGKTFAISSDKKILESLKERGLSTLEIGRGDVHLEGFKHGFIGGASGYFEGTVYFTGRFSKEREVIVERFLRDLDIDFLYLSDGKIVDLGGMYFRRDQWIR
ncbi:MAG: hypothetical protein GX219_03625 [Tissierellia bacterium]|nr:hypothetical protein [Tissierellia bacterium]